MTLAPRAAAISLPPLAISLASVGARAQGGFAGSLRASLATARDLGFRAVCLDAAARDARPRDLDRSARRDLAATMRRLELDFAGVELWIPPERFADPLRAERATDAVGEALAFAAEISRLHPPAGLWRSGPVVSIALPQAGAERAVEEIERRAAQAGALVADFGLAQSRRAALSDHIRVGVEANDAAPSSAAAAGPAPDLSIAALPIVAARISGWPPETGPSRVDALAFVVALLASGFRAPVALDLRARAEPDAAASRALAAWADLIKA